MKKIIIGIIIILIVLLLIGGYLGFVPILSDLLDKPKDLGINYNQEDLNSIFEKAPYVIETVPEGTLANGEKQYEGNQIIKTTFSSEEVSACISLSSWSANPFKDVQVKFNEDGTAEASGKIIFDNAINYANRIGYSTSKVTDAMDKYKIPKTNISFYISGTFEIKDNTPNITVQTLKLGKITVPKNIFNDNMANTVTSTYLNKIPNYKANNISIENSQLIYDVATPKKVIREGN